MARRSTLLGLILLAVIVMPGTLHAGAAVDVTTIQADGKDITDFGKIYVRESTPISITFTYKTDSSTDVTGWQVWIDKADSGALFDNGEFSGSSATVTFTTDDIGRQVRGLGLTQIPWRTKPSYDYVMTVKILSTVKPVNTTDGDQDDYYDDYNTVDGDEDPDTVTDKPTQQVTIHVDEDPPLAPTLLENPVPGEESLLVSWESVTKSESGETEASGLGVIFCVRESSSQDAAALNRVTARVLLAEDGDLDADEAPQDGDLDPDDTPQDGDLDPDEDPSERDNDDTPADGDEPVDGDTPVTDGDEPVRDGDEETEELQGCLDPMPESDGGTSFRITGLENNVLYEIRGKSVDLAGNVSRLWSEPILGSPQEVDDFWEAYKNAGGDEKGGFCFIATAAYGSYSADQVQLLRRFRDDVLNQSALGQALVLLYYTTSPPLADWIARHELAKIAVRVALAPVLAVLGLAYGVNPWLLLLPALLLGVMLLGSVVWLVHLRRREVVR